MMNRFSDVFRSHSRPRFSQLLVAGAISTAALLLGLVPESKPGSFELTFNDAAYAQSAVPAISNDEVQSYARSVLAIEPIRLTAYNEIKRIRGNEEVPAIACHRPNSLDNLVRDIREIAVNYCTQAIDIVESNSLSITRFNIITMNLQSSPELASRIQEELLRLQQDGSATR